LILVQVAAIEEGMRLARDILTPQGLLLIPRGFVLNAAVKNILLNRGINEVWIYKREEEEDNPLVKAEGDFFREYNRALAAVNRMMLRLSQNQPFEGDDLRRAVLNLMPAVLTSPRIIYLLAKARHSGETLYTHALNVSVLSMLLGKWAGLDEGEIFRLGLAGVLHDIGKTKIEKSILEKRGLLSSGEWKIIKAHPGWGYIMALRSGIDDGRVLKAILQHHEREDGSGYPEGIAGKEIEPLAKAVMVADVFDAVTADRPYRRRFTIYHAAEVLQAMRFGQIDPAFATVFLEGLASYYVGNKVILSNGEIGEVVWVDRFNPTRPVVKVGEKFYNLLQCRDLRIEDELAIISEG